MTINIRDCFLLAASTYTSWREDFDFCGPFNELPLLKNPERFSRFCSEYSVYRGSPTNGGIPLRCAARKALLEFSSPSSIVELVNNCGLSTSKHKTLRKDWSGASKVLWFWQPGRFAPSDQYARAGLTSYCENMNFSDPDEYVCQFNKAFLNWDQRPRVAELIKNCELSDQKDLIQRATFDVFLMHKGGRVL